MADNKKWSNDLTTKAIKDNSDFFIKLTDEISQIIKDALNNGKELKVFRDNLKEKDKLIKEKNIG